MTTARFSPHLEILPAAQRRLWPELAQSAQCGFVLYGGTATALRLGHRQSIDFDFFSHLPLNREEMKEAFPFIKISRPIQDDMVEGNAVTYLVPYGRTDLEHVKVSFFGNIGMGRVGSPQMTEDGVLQVASIEDLMITKVKVIFQRAELKDYLDISRMLQSGASLPHALAGARLLYGSAFSPSECLRALTYYKDGDLNKISATDKVTLTALARQTAASLGDLPNVEIRSLDLFDRSLLLKDEERPVRPSF